ncbi:MAG: AAA family ATPase [Anaerolineae bacterium]|nr:AAA family ATPase [Anaerolineae bacterium]
MKCPNCAHENASDARFCENCGQPLERVCPNCGRPVSSSARFCQNCGFNLTGAAATARSAPVAKSEPLEALRRAAPQSVATKVLAARERMEGERKTVTTLFTDIVNSTMLAEQMDPEEWHEIVSGAHRHVSQAVYRYEGTIAQLLGDGVLAFFGAPIAHEDDAERAVCAALDILTSIQDYARTLRQRQRVPSFQMRVGLNTGLVVVGHIGDDLHMEYLAVGDTVNLAARMQSAAEPDTILISEQTHRLVASLFDFEDRGMVTVKGKAEPVRVYRVRGRRKDAARTRGIVGLNSPLVGREREMATLRSRVEELRQGQGQIISVMGEAGLGKSRLVAELRKSLVADGVLAEAAQEGGIGVNAPLPSSLGWLEGRSLSYESATPYAPFIDLLRRAFNLDLAAEDLGQYDKMKARVAELLPGSVSEIAPFLAMLLGLKFAGEDYERVKYLTPPDIRERVTQATCALCEGLAATRPLVLIFEDLHWVDPTSLDLMERLSALTDRVPLMILALFRPRRQEPSWRFHEVAARDYGHRYTALMLEPLDESNARTLVANLLHIEDLPEKVRSLILRKAEGNPFFVEEVIRSLLDARLVVRENSHWRATREIEHIAVPDTLTGVIMARLDRLDEETKRVAQTAAVIGREFQFDVLADVYDVRQGLDDVLGNLQRRELIREKSRLPHRLYLFKHVLTQETAYSSILLSKRRELHQRVAESLERVDKERVHDIARHFLEAQEETRALPYLVDAGDRAARAYATPEAISYYSRALEILQAVEDMSLMRRAYEGLGGALTLANEIPRAVETYHQMFHVAKDHSDIPMQVSALNKLSWVVALRLGQFPEDETHLSEAERLAREYNDLAGLAEHYWIRCMMCTATADFDGAMKHLSESVQIGRDLNLEEQLATGLAHVAGTLILMTRFDEAWQIAQEALRASEKVGNRENRANLLASDIPIYHIRNGDLETAYQIAEEAANIGAHIGSAYAESWATWTMGSIALQRGEYEHAVEILKRQVRVARLLEQSMPFPLVMGLGTLGTAYLEISDKLADKAFPYHAEALILLEHPAGLMAGGTTWADVGYCVLARGDTERAAQFFQKGLTQPTPTILLQKPFFLVGQALVALARSNLDDAASLAEGARTYAEERAMKNTYPMIFLVRGRISAAREEHGLALADYSRAGAFAREMQMRPLMLQALVGSVQALSMLGRMDEADMKRQEARSLVEEIAALFKDQELRALFLDNAMAKVG